METVDCVVVGAGVVGLAVARAVARRGRSCFVLERERQFGTGTSARNSEVIHAGIYYAPGSLKARLCVAGRAQLYEYCAARGVPHRRCGKLIVATAPEQEPALDALRQTAAANGVALTPLTGAQARAMEPGLACTAALLSAETGIVDSHAYMLALLGELEAAGGQLVCAAPVGRIAKAAEGWAVWLEGEAAPALAARLVINAAGLDAQRLAGSIEGLPTAAIPPLHLARGVYFTLSGRTPFSRLVYPVPQPGGLGIHLTLDLAGQARFGPDVEWIDRVDYSVDPARRSAFAAAIREYWPGIEENRLVPGYAGIRPKLSGPGQEAADFVVQGPREHGLDGIVNLFGIESPGLTGALALAEIVARQGVLFLKKKNQKNFE